MFFSQKKTQPYLFVTQSSDIALCNGHWGSHRMEWHKGSWQQKPQYVVAGRDLGALEFKEGFFRTQLLGKKVLFN
jgi:hypothetical protein